MVTASRPRRRRVDAITNRERIVAAARLVFARDAHQSLDRVAAEAGVGIATLYRHFANREELIRAVYVSMFDSEVRPLLNAESSLQAPRRAFMTIADRLLDLVANNGELTVSPISVAVLSDELLGEFLEPFGVLLRRAQELGEIRRDLEPGDIPRILGMLIAGLSTPATSPAIRQRYLALMFDAVSSEGAEPLPPLPENEPGDLRSALAPIAHSRTASQPRR